MPVSQWINLKVITGFETSGQNSDQSKYGRICAVDRSAESWEFSFLVSEISMIIQSTKSLSTGIFLSRNVAC